METELLNWAFNNGVGAVAFVVNTILLFYVLKSHQRTIDNNTDALRALKEKLK